MAFSGTTRPHTARAPSSSPGLAFRRAVSRAGMSDSSPRAAGMGLLLLVSSTCRTMLPRPEAILSGSDRANKGTDTCDVLLPSAVARVPGVGGTTTSWCSRESTRWRSNVPPGPLCSQRLASSVDRRPFWKMVLQRGSVTRREPPLLVRDEPASGGVSIVIAASLSRSLPMDPRLLRSTSSLLPSPCHSPGRSASVLP